jgi:fumarate reductase iron-sulfur subunit
VANGAQTASGEYLQRRRSSSATSSSRCASTACCRCGLSRICADPQPSAQRRSLAHRWNQDSRDGGRAARQEEIAATEGVWYCSFVGACSEVCPEHVDPAAAIQQVKIRSMTDWYLEHLMPWLRK